MTMRPKLKYYIPASLTMVARQIVPYIALSGFVALLVMVIIGQAMPPPESYGVNECQKIALQYQKEFGGSLIWIQPIDEHGNAIYSAYGAHVINKVYDPVLGELRYVDYGNKMETRADYIIQTMPNGNRARAYDLSIERPEFGLIWYY